MRREIAAVLDLRPGAVYRHRQKKYRDLRAEIVGLALCCRTCQELIVYRDAVGLIVCPIQDFAQKWKQETAAAPATPAAPPVPERVIDYRCKGSGA